MAFVLSTARAYCITLVNFRFLAWFFRKRPISFVVLDNTLDSHSNDTRGTGTPCLFPGKKHPLDSQQSPFPHHGHTFTDEYAHLAVGPRALSSLTPFQQKPSSHKTLFHMLFRVTVFLFSAQHFRGSSCSNLCTSCQLENLA